MGVLHVVDRILGGLRLRLPDQLPDNIKMRMAHKPLSAFIDAACELAPLYPPGTQVGYQSMGTAMLGEIVHQVSGVTLPEFLRKEVFEPLGMADTSLGWQPEKKERIAVVRVGPEQQKTDWHWNTPYWLGFGAPWGGLITSPADFARFCQTMLNGGVCSSTQRSSTPRQVGRRLPASYVSGVHRRSDCQRLPSRASPTEAPM